MNKTTKTMTSFLRGKLMNKLRNNKGFSLIELMIVVAIIGILASVAIPNFQKFIRRSKQAEAKSNLSVVYSAQRAFQGEWQFFHGLFEHIGYSPEGDLRYEVTTAAGPVTALYTQRKGGQITGASTNSTAWCGTVSANCIVDVTAQAAAGAASTADTFVATAGADLGGDANDEWSIDEGKGMTQTSVGE